MSIIDLPTKGIPFDLVTLREIWTAPEPTDRQVWAVCPYLRNLERCSGCPSVEVDPHHGEVKRGCRGLAEEACRIVMAAKTDTPV